MSRPKGSKNRITIAVKDQVEASFNRVLKKSSGKYLDDLAYEHPAIWCGLISRCIPAQATLAISHHIIDLHLAIKDADDRLKLIGDSSDRTTIELKPIDAQLVDSLVDCKDKDLQPIDIVEPMAPKLRIEQE